MSFLVTYGSLKSDIFLNHFGSSPSYRPSFRSRWYFSLGGFIIALWVMFKINSAYALASIIVMTGIYSYLKYIHQERHGLESLFANALFQINRNLQVFLQKSGSRKKTKEWSPVLFAYPRILQEGKSISVIRGLCTDMALELISTYDGYYSQATHSR
jgi:hypothetical protein